MAMREYEFFDDIGEVKYKGRVYPSLEALEESRMEAAEARWEMERDERLLNRE